ncbi:hypothetical protein BZU93_29560, partial [Salmonella enterica subsp. enterica]|nr:hypothetical protein [Salmonella enterica subsp. enterica serovar Enteritidis]
IRALSRSAELTAGSRWSLLGLFVIMIIMTILLYLVFWVAADFVEAVSGSVGPIIMLAASSCLASILFSIFTAVAYVELRFVKEGADVKDLAEIFA